MSITSPQVIDGRYRLEDEIGHGGMAVVYRAYDERLNRQVAIKMMRHQFVNDQTFLSRFRREAQALANLSHPNLAAVWDTGEAAGVPYIIMEYVDGDNLKTRIVAEAPFSAERSIRLMIQICEGVGAAHRAGVVHRDLKPQNILISRLGQIKVADFGIARSLATAAAATHTGQVWGTAQYIAPEQAAGQAVSPATDVYSLGIILFEMLTGRLPFEGETPLALAMQHVHSPAPSPRTLNPKIPPGLDAIALKAIMKQPDERYRDADALCATLKAYQRLGEQTTGPIPVVPRAARAAAVDFGAASIPRATGRAVTYTPPASAGQVMAPPAERDWGTLALGITAAVAVLGLIPLYWMVIQRFTGG